MRNVSGRPLSRQKEQKEACFSYVFVTENNALMIARRIGHGANSSDWVVHNTSILTHRRSTQPKRSSLRAPIFANVG